MADLVAADLSEEDLERRFIEETYGDDRMLAAQIGHLSRFPVMRPRMTLLHQARVDY